MTKLRKGHNYDNRPYRSLDEMHEDMRQKWNKKVTNGDTVYVLGDIGRKGKNEGLIALMATLKGRKVLIRGNHDDMSDYRLKQIFAEVCDYKELSDSFEGKNYKLVLSHYPLLMWNGQRKGVILLYGHTHTSQEDTYFQKCLSAFLYDPKYIREDEKRGMAINVGCMHAYMGYEPRCLKELLCVVGERSG
ncbi:MAG: metallophosphoesterase family protein [Clostridiales bacterium]|nr:metallophosphoesterase family protein [Clostridiales bacterium]